MKQNSRIFIDKYSWYMFHRAAFWFYRKVLQTALFKCFFLSVLGRCPAFLLPEQPGKIQGIVISYGSGNIAYGQFSFLQQTAGPAYTEILLILIDSSIVEMFVNQGEIVFTTRIYLEKNEREISFQQWENISLETVKE